MRKLTLDLDALRVEQFEAAHRRPESRGTVVAADAFMTGPDNCVTISCGDSHIRPCEAYY